MALHIQYLTDNKGDKKAVQIPYQEWLEFCDQYKRLEQYSSLKKGIENAFTEVEIIEAGIVNKVTLAEFLNES